MTEENLGGSQYISTGIGSEPLLSDRSFLKFPLFRPTTQNDRIDHTNTLWGREYDIHSKFRQLPGGDHKKLDIFIFQSDTEIYIIHHPEIC